MFTTMIKLGLKHDLAQQPTRGTRVEDNCEEICLQTLAENSLIGCRTELYSGPPLLDPAEPPSWEHIALNTHAVTRVRLQTWLLTNTLTLTYH